jgi:glycosyltransferase involved in cell wall biosynthesis
VGIDLSPASLIRRTPGTGRLVSEQSLALLKLEVPWQWVPVLESKNNPLFEAVEALHPIFISSPRHSVRTFFQLGQAWAKAGCDLGFCTANFVPLTGPPVMTNFYDATIYEHARTWIQTKRLLNLALIRALSYQAIVRSRLLLVNSEYSANKLRALFPRYAAKFVANQCGFIPPPSPAPEFKPAWAEQIKKPFFLYVGVFSENKNQWRLLQAWGDLQQQQPDLPALVLAGPCAEDYRTARIEPLLQALPRPGEVLVLGAIPEADLTWAYQKALVYIQPSISEGFNLCVLEAMHHRRPVLCANTTSHPEACGDAALFFDPFSLSAMKEAIRQAIGCSEMREQLVQKGTRHVVNFTWKANAERARAALNRVLETL